jgi:hypothetical protein
MAKQQEKAPEVKASGKTSGKEARKNREARRVRKALRHAQARKATEGRIGRIRAHLTAIEAGKAPVPNMERKARREAAISAQKAAAEGKRRPAIVVQAADGKITEVQ